VPGSGEHKKAPWSEVAAQFDQALQLDPQAREVWLAELGKQQPRVAHCVRSLLEEIQALDGAGFLVERPVWKPLHAPDLVPGDNVGPYDLIREIGYGGMSSVWLAQRRDQQFKRQVALKLPFLGPCMQLERFIRERDILAALTHPNIARLYDAGISESGQPYLAMEYVCGKTLTRRCDEERLTIRERLMLFLQVLQAVQFAHAELIIHRDLKPSNILVTTQGRVVLLDFGIGKLLAADDRNETHLTQIAGCAFTPQYASPEQITGHALGTASDIYSLGVILYELLTGNCPYEPAHQSRAAIEQAILTGHVRRPSQSGISPTAALGRGTSVRGLARTLARDLDTIVLKALKNNPVDRYASVSAFAQDISNYLECLPVSAQPDSRWYRLTRFTARYKTPVIAAGIATTALLAGAMLAAWQARTASVARDRAVALASRNQAVSEFLGRVITEAAESAKPVTVSEMLSRSERLALTDRSISAENRAALLEMIADRYQSMDETDRAARLLESASRIVAGSPDHALRSRLTCDHAATVATFGHSDGPVRAISREIEQLQSDPETASFCLLALCRIALIEHHALEGIHQARMGLARAREAGRGSGEIAASLLSDLAYGYHLIGRNIDAQRCFEQALREYADLGRARSDGALVVINNWGVALLNAGVPRRALQLFQQEEEVEAERESGSLPTTTTVRNQAEALLALGRFESARATLARARQLAQQRKDEFTELYCSLSFAKLTIETRSFAETPQYLQRAMQLMSAAPADSPPMLLHAALQGAVDMAAGRISEARAQFQRAMTGKDASPASLAGQLGMVDAELAARRPAAAVERARGAVQTAVALQGGLPYSFRTGLAWVALGHAYRQLGDRVQATRSFEAGIRHLSNTVDADHPALLQARQLLSADKQTASPPWLPADLQ
jgi:serine/threonine protein kinase/Tfp pilus assembly protein PilF